MTRLREHVAELAVARGTVCCCIIYRTIEVLSLSQGFLLLIARTFNIVIRAAKSAAGATFTTIFAI